MTARSAARHRRVLLKLSGEGLAGSQGVVDPSIVDRLAGEIQEVLRSGTQVALVVGGGNFLRGDRLPGMDRVTADQMGMLATLMNGLALRDRFASRGIETRTLSAFAVGGFCEPYSRERALEHLEAGRLVVLAGGTGHPFFSTDSAAALRALELGADCLLKATQVDGVYSADPNEDPRARRYDSIGWGDVLAQGLRFMDAAAIVLCQENRIPILVFRLADPGSLVRACRGEQIGTWIGRESARAERRKAPSSKKGG